MRISKIITAISMILIIAIMIVFGTLMFYVLKDSIQTSNKNIINETQEKDVQQPNNNIDNQDVSMYYYNQLDNIAKIFYDGLKENKDNLILGNYIIDFDTKFNTVLNSEGGEEKIGKAFQSAWNAFSYDNVDLFYIDITKMTLVSEYRSLGGFRTYRVSIGPGDNDNYFHSTFKTREDVEKAKVYLEDIKRQMTQQIYTDNTYTKIAKIHNWLIHFVMYEDSEKSNVQHTIYGALNDGKAVCEGYARAFKYLADGVGIPCILVSGTGRNSQGRIETHAWNDVYIDQSWYAIDTTWDDPIVIGGKQTNEMRNKYFLKGSEEFFKDHTEEGEISEDSINFKFPTLSVKDYNKN